jgi:DNA-directed RNA polymerase subunit RPC12/RpoP
VKICTRCSAQNVDQAIRCQRCGGHTFYLNRGQWAQNNEASPAPGIVRRALFSPSVRALILVCFIALGAECSWRVFRLSRLSRELAAERIKASSDHAAAIDDEDRTFQAQFDREEAKYKSYLLNTAWTSGSLARERHEKEWALRIAHDPRFAKTVLETNLLTMERLGMDATVAAQTAIEKVARLASPGGSRVEVAPDGDGYRVRVAFMMSRLSDNESGAFTKHKTTAALRVEIQELSAQVMRDLYEYCGSRGIKSIAVTCDHTLRETQIPPGATEAEREELLQRAKPIPGRLYRVSLDQFHAQAVVNWRSLALSRLTQLWAVEYDGLTHLTLTTIQGSPLGSDQRDAVGELQF